MKHLCFNSRSPADCSSFLLPRIILLKVTCTIWILEEKRETWSLKVLCMNAQFCVTLQHSSAATCWPASTCRSAQRWCYTSSCIVFTFVFIMFSSAFPTNGIFFRSYKLWFFYHVFLQKSRIKVEKSVVGVLVEAFLVGCGFARGFLHNIQAFQTNFCILHLILDDVCLNCVYLGLSLSLLLLAVAQQI